MDKRTLFHFLLFPVFWGACGSTLPSTPERRGPSPVPASFFALSALPVTDVPKVDIGALGHPGFAWSTIEQSRGVFDFQVFDDYVATAQRLRLVEAETNTVSMSIEAPTMERPI